MFLLQLPNGPRSPSGPQIPPPRRGELVTMPTGDVAAYFRGSRIRDG